MKLSLMCINIRFIEMLNKRDYERVGLIKRILRKYVKGTILKIEFTFIKIFLHINTLTTLSYSLGPNLVKSY